MADERKLNEQPSINKDYYYYYYQVGDLNVAPVTCK